MGNNYIRRYLKQESRWSDPETKRHKHDFDIPALVVLERPKGNNDYFQVMKCRYCHSFRCIPRTGSADGFIVNLDDMDIVPHIKMYFKTNHKYILGFKDLKFDKVQEVNSHSL